MNSKIMQIIDQDTSEVVVSREFDGDYSFQHTGAGGEIFHIGHINSARWFGGTHDIRNARYAPIAQKLIEKFDELAHINVNTILFLENVTWSPPKKKARKKHG